MKPASGGVPAVLIAPPSHHGTHSIPPFSSILTLSIVRSNPPLSLSLSPPVILPSSSLTLSLPPSSSQAPHLFHPPGRFIVLSPLLPSTSLSLPPPSPPFFHPFNRYPFVFFLSSFSLFLSLCTPLNNP